MKIKASTELYGIFGNPARHSKSPILQNSWIEQCGFNAAYLAFEPKIEDFNKSFEGLCYAGLKGCNITAPFKEIAAKICEKVTPDIRIMGAVNTIKIGEQINGFNTDGHGLILDLDIRAKHWRENNSKIAIIGTGGAAKGVVDAFLQNGIKQINFIGRSQNKLDEIINSSNLLPNAKNIEFIGHAFSNVENAIDDCGLIINATTIGLKDNGELFFDLSKSLKDSIVYDMVYFPKTTKFIKSAIEQNRFALNGIGMLVGQGALAFEKWFSIRPDFEFGLKSIQNDT
jgi:shikimate dehydrogenase